MFLPSHDIQSIVSLCGNFNGDVDSNHWYLKECRRQLNCWLHVVPSKKGRRAKSGDGSWGGVGWWVKTTYIWCTIVQWPNINCNDTDDAHPHYDPMHSKSQKLAMTAFWSKKLAEKYVKCDDKSVQIMKMWWIPRWRFFCDIWTALANLMSSAFST